MNARFLAFWDRLRASFWFVPAILAASAVLLSVIMVEIDRRVTVSEIGWLGWVVTNNPDGARALLSTVAGSMVTVAGVVFSITIVALTLASNQFGPRLLRNFMRDPGNQVVLGIFVAAFLYSLMVLRTVQAVNDDQFVPHLSVSLGVLFAGAGLVVLIYFIHHVSRSIQAPFLAAQVGDDLVHAIDRLFPGRIGEEPDDQEARERRERALPQAIPDDAWALCSRSEGYVQAVDDARLLKLAQRNDLVIQLHYRPGEFVMQGDVLAHLWPLGHGAEHIERELDEAILVARERTPTQDVEFAIHQLTEVGVRALSPGINDPFTAVTCADWLGRGFARMVSHPLPSAYRYDDHDALRLIAEPPTFSSAADAAFNPLRQYGADAPMVLIRLLEVLARIAHRAERPQDRDVIRRHARAIWRTAHERITSVEDLADVDERYHLVLRALNERTPDTPDADGITAAVEGENCATREVS